MSLGAALHEPSGQSCPTLGSGVPGHGTEAVPSWVIPHCSSCKSAHHVDQRPRKKRVLQSINPRIPGVSDQSSWSAGTTRFQGVSVRMCVVISVYCLWICVCMVTCGSHLALKIICFAHIQVHACIIGSWASSPDHTSILSCFQWPLTFLLAPTGGSRT